MESARTGPLLGRRIILTRPVSRGDDLAQELESLGASVLVLPTIRVEPVADSGSLEEICRNLNAFDWLVFTSVNAVQSFASALTRIGVSIASAEGVRTCAVGPATSREMTAHGFAVDVMPSRYLGEAVLAAVESEGPVEGKRFLLPRSDRAADTLPRMLREAGAEVTEVVAYRTVPDLNAGDALRSVLVSDAVDVVVFASGSAVHASMEMVGGAIGEVIVATIGPVTTAVAEGYGMKVAIEAEEHTSKGLVAAILEHFT